MPEFEWPEELPPYTLEDIAKLDASILDAYPKCWLCGDMLADNAKPGDICGQCEIERHHMCDPWTTPKEG